jgi:hypothetical protein
MPNKNGTYKYVPRAKPGKTGDERELSFGGGKIACKARAQLVRPLGAPSVNDYWRIVQGDGSKTITDRFKTLEDLLGEWGKWAELKYEARKKQPAKVKVKVKRKPTPNERRAIKRAQTPAPAPAPAPASYNLEFDTSLDREMFNHLRKRYGAMNLIRTLTEDEV